jgi:hypothetical protein
MTTMPQAMPRALLGALHQASHKHRLTHAAGNAWRNARRYARTYERTYLRTLFKPWVDLSRNVSRAKCATIHPCPGAEATLRARLTDRHRPCRQAADELAALVTAERDRQRRGALDLRQILETVTFTLNPDQVRRRLATVADDLEGPAKPNTDDDLREQLTAERERARRARSELGNILAIATITPNSERRRISDLRDTLEGPAEPTVADELREQLAAEQDQTRWARRQLLELHTLAARPSTSSAWVRHRIRQIAGNLEGPAEPNTAESDRRHTEDDLTRYLREQLAAEQNRAHKARAILADIANQAADGCATADVTECLWDVVKDLAGPAGLEHRRRGDTGSVVLHIELADGLDGPAPNPLTSPNPSGPPVTPGPSWIDCGTPTCTSCWLQRHDGHNVGLRHEDGALRWATCHDCGARHDPHLSNPQAPTNPSADRHG